MSESRKSAFRIGERTFPYVPPADRPKLRKHPIGSTEAVFESGEVGIALNTFPRLVLEVPYDRTCPYRGTHFSVFSISAFGRRYVNGRTGSTEAVFESGEVGIALNTIPRLVLEIPYDRTCPYRETDFRPCSHSSFNLGCEPKSEKCILSYGHVFSIGTSHTNLVMVFGAIPGSSDLKTGLLRLFSYFFLF